MSEGLAQRWCTLQKVSGDGPVLYTRLEAVGDGQRRQERKQWFLHTVILCSYQSRRRHKSTKLTCAGILWT